MASVKIFSLVVRTLAKPIANTMKQQAVEHESFRSVCIGVAQRMHRFEARMRLGLLNEEAKNIKPLNDTRAIQNGATFIAETFLFVVAAGLVLGETYRSSRKESKRRDDVRERIEALEEEIKGMRGVMEGKVWEVGLDEVRERNDQLDRVLSTVVSNGLKAGWLALGHNELEGEPSGAVGMGMNGGGAGSVLPLLDLKRAYGRGEEKGAGTGAVLEETDPNAAVSNRPISTSIPPPARTATAAAKGSPSAGGMGKPRSEQKSGRDQKKVDGSSDDGTAGHFVDTAPRSSFSETSNNSA